VTALAALRYVEQGKWSLDANINDKLVSWKLPENDFTKKEKVTLRRLLSHNAGTTVHGFAGYSSSEPLPTLQQVLDGAKPANSEPVRVDILPGSEARYSGGGYLVVQQMMVDQLKKPFPQIIQEAVFSPLGLKHSTFEQPLPPALAATAASATRGDGKSVEGRWHVYPELAAAGLWTTPSDLARLTTEVLKARAGKSKAVLSQAMTKQMLTPQSEGFGLGFQLEGKERFGHDGVNEGFQSSIIAFTDSGSGVVMMANSDNGMLLFERFAASFATEYGWKSFTHRLESPLMTADLLSRFKGTEAAVAWYKAKVREAPARGMSPGVLGSLGYRLLLEGQLADAVKVLEANVELYPDVAEAYDVLGEVYVKAGRNTDAITSFKKSLQLDPKNTHAVEQLKKLGASL
jgi:CubicO group peptidase (beta-lactamase class C family)